jgi:RNA polymerase sigma factor (sigma-70 family)
MADPHPLDLLSVFHSHYEDLRRFILRKCGSVTLAAEITQELYIRLRQIIPSPRLAEPRAYLFRIADHLVVDQLRRQQRHAQRHTHLLDSELISSAPDPATIVESRQHMEILQQAILELPNRCREVFLLHKGAGKSYSVIAAELEISIRTVEHHIAKAMLHCRSRLRAAGRKV